MDISKFAEWLFEPVGGCAWLSICGKTDELKKELSEKYSNLGVEDILLNDEIDDTTKERILNLVHNYSEEETKELLSTAKKESRKEKLRDLKRKIAQKAQELYSNIPTDDIRQPISDAAKIFVWKRDMGKCVKCGGKGQLEFDHIIPVSKGGSNSERNIQLLCERCNREKRDSII